MSHKARGAVAALVGLWLLCMVITVIVALAASGCTKTQVRYVNVPVMAEREPCLTNPRVVMHPWQFTPGSAPDARTDCPEKFGMCVEPLDQVALEMTMRSLMSRIAEDWFLCGIKLPDVESKHE